MTKSTWRHLFLWRGWLAVLALLLASCGGGGGGGSGQTLTIDTANPPLQGNWQLTVSANNGPESAPVAVDASAVPTSSQVAQLTATAVAQLVARTSFQGYTVSQNGTTITVTDPDTNYVLVINSITTSDYQGCGTCLAGTTVSFTVVANFTESGTLDGTVIPPNTDNVTLRFRYRRVS